MIGLLLRLFAHLTDAAKAQIVHCASSPHMSAGSDNVQSVRLAWDYPAPSATVAYACMLRVITEPNTKPCPFVVAAWRWW